MAKPNLFNSVMMTRPSKNMFDLSHSVKLSGNMGNLIPVLCEEVVPGDHFKGLGCECIVRFAPMVAPVMHQFHVTIHYFFVPNRILWENWEKFITQTALDTSLQPEFPYVNITDGWYTDLADYMGIPSSNSNPVAINAMPFAAYQAIYHEYYRDQNLIPEFDYKLTDGDNTLDLNLNILRKRAWEHDYFTSALPFAQKGNGVNLPIAGFDDVRVRVNQANTVGGAASIANTLTPNPLLISGDTPSFGADAGEDLYAETSQMNASSTTINDLRRAFRLQEWYEKNARGGTRYSENILAHFGVKSSDQRLDRPEYITGTKTPVVISEVLNTSDTAEAPQGNMAGHGISVTSGRYGNYFCEEHGYIIGIMSVMPKPDYAGQLPKHFLKIEDPFQYYWPSFAHIGEQEILEKEIYFPANSSNTFGYTPRYAEYKYSNNRVAGDFRSTLDFWTAARFFAGQPNLNQDFIEMNSASVDRIFAVTDPAVHKLYVHCYHHIKAIRPMPKFGTPQF